MPPRQFCSELSEANGESLGATASRVEHWLLLEYRSLWARDELAASLIPAAAKDHLRAQLAALRRSRLVFVRRPERRGRAGLRVFYGRTSEREPWFRGLELQSYDDLAGLDFVAALTGSGDRAGEPLDHPLLVVCTHGKRDPCCARRGRPLYEALREAADDDWVWQSSHVGGDRFAGNLVCLPEGVYYGRVTRGQALTVLAEHLAGRVELEHYRGRCCYPFPVQAAEREARARSGLLGLGDIRVERVEGVAEGTWRVDVRAGPMLYAVEVVAEHGELTQLTCASPTPKSPRRFAVRDVEILRERGA